MQEFLIKSLKNINEQPEITAVGNRVVALIRTGPDKPPLFAIQLEFDSREVLRDTSIREPESPGLQKTGGSRLGSHSTKSVAKFYKKINV